MVYKFSLISEEVEKFSREIEIDADSTFLELNNAILDSVKYEKDQMTSFALCNDDWEKEQEISLMDMGSSSDYDNVLMDEAVLSDYVTDEGQKLLFIYDMFSERAFFMRLKAITVGKNLDAPVCVSAKGEAPEQIVIDDTLDVTKTVESFNTDEFYGDEGFNEDEFDVEGFSDMNFEGEY